MNDVRLAANGQVDGTITQNAEGESMFHVPSARIAHLVQLGLHAERKQQRRIARRRAEKAARRRNRPNKEN